jgi:RHS repeat-associated protein
VSKDNAAGERVSKDNSAGAPQTLYLHDGDGNQIAELDAALAVQHVNVYSGKHLVGTWNPATGQVYYAYADWLGTKRYEADGGGVYVNSWASLPFGDNQTALGAGVDATEHHFTGQEHDAESGLDHFAARYYQSQTGRWLLPDWSATPVPVPYAAFTNPQSLNLYTYVGNNPVNAVDADGHLEGGDSYSASPGSAAMDCIKNEFLGGCGSAYATDDGGIGPPIQIQTKITAQMVTDAQNNANAASSQPAQQENTNSTSTTQDQNTHYVTVSYWWTGAKGFGHIGVGVDTNNTQGFSTADEKAPWWKRLFGAPAARTEFDIPQHTKNGKIAAHSYIHIPISADQAAAMRKAIVDRTANPGHYNLLFNNCAGFVENVLHAGGVSGVPHSEVFGPMVLGGILAYEDSWR